MRNIYLSIIAMIIAGAVFADTSIEGLRKDVPILYTLNLELSSNDTDSYIISIHPVNHIAVNYSNHEIDKPRIEVSTKLTSEEYQSIYQLAYVAISNFKISDETYGVRDATHFELSLNVNRREFSIKYYSIPHIKDASEDMHKILEIVNTYFPKDKILKANKPLKNDEKKRRILVKRHAMSNW
jgi:hypothetical protein